jgi:RNase H-fold protein (predicted Holliday junction resolvase)
MSWTKQQLINAALEEIGISYAFDVQPEELQSALRRLDSMMAEWNVEGIRVGYPIATIDTSSLTTDSGVPDSATEAIITNLAIRIAPSYGKAVAREVKVTAKKAYNTLQMRALTQDPQEKQFPNTLPIGAGNKRYKNRNQNFMPTPTDPVDVGPDSILELN